MHMVHPTAYPLAVVILALASGTGCYLSHERPNDAGLGPPRMDAGPPSARDLGPDVRLDGGSLPPTIDASLPPIVEPDVPDGARPSDDPDASTWGDPPPTSGGDPCCTVGESVGLDDIANQAGNPVVAWNGATWGVAWYDQPPPGAGRAGAVFLELDATAHPLRPRVPIDGMGSTSALVWYGGRYLLAASPPGWRLPPPSFVGVLDRRGALADVTLVPETAKALARFPAAHAWAVATYEDTGSETRPVRLRLLGDDLDAVGSAVELGEATVDTSVAIVALKSRLVALRVTEDGIVQHTFAGAGLAPISTGVALRSGTFLDEYGIPHVGQALAATGMRDTAVVVTMDRSDVWTVVFDPFADAVVAGPTRIAPSPAAGGLAVAADNAGGTLGVCYADGEGPYGGYVIGGGDPGDPRPPRFGPPDPDSIRFALLGRDGARIGAPVTVATNLRYVASCAVAAADADHYVVVYWNAARDAPRHSILAATVTVRR